MGHLYRIYTTVKEYFGYRDINSTRLRNAGSGYPTATGGRGADTAMMTAWLEDFLGTLETRHKF